MKNREAPPALDAEKTGREQLLEKFRPPPDISENVSRGTLLVGTRGSGKTMFLRRCRHLHRGLAIYGDLRKLLNPISSDTGAGGLSFDTIPPSLELSIQAKTIALLATWLAGQALEAGIEVPARELLKTLPPALHPITEGTDRLSLQVLERSYNEICSQDLTVFSRGLSLAGFLDFASLLAEKCLAKEAPLLILLDRAEEVPYPCLTPVLNLLDQVHPFLSIVAARPGILGPGQLLSSNTPTPGDHFDIRHLGRLPYSSEWQTFQHSALEAWIPHTMAQLPPEYLQLIFQISRDSLRHALEIVYNSIDESGIYDHSLAIGRIELLRATLLSAAQGKLRTLNGDLNSLVSYVRSKMSQVKLPILLQLDSVGQRSLALAHPHREMPKHERFVRLALRTGFFSMKHGDAWHPYARLEEIEISPIFIWRVGDIW